MASIFVSYSRKDQDILRILEPQFRNIYGYGSTWYDIGIPGGDEWWKRIVSEIRQCQIFIFLMSDTAVESEYCQRELQKAIYNRKTVMPVLLETYTKEYPQPLPEFLAETLQAIQYIDLRSGFNDLSKLWGAINRIRDGTLSGKMERWILYNQFEILQMLHRMNGETRSLSEFDKYKEIIGMGYEWHYDQISQHIQPSMEYGDCEEVIDILDMFRALHVAVQEYKPEFDDNPRCGFRGFDGNYETDYFEYAQFIIEDDERFRESRPRHRSGYNSHIPMVPLYRRMLEQWHLTDERQHLSKEEVYRIISA